jgi:hypothetical protein
MSNIAILEPELPDDPITAPLWANLLILKDGRRFLGEEAWPSAKLARDDHERWFVAFMRMTGRFVVLTAEGPLKLSASEYGSCIQVPCDGL